MKTNIDKTQVRQFLIGMTRRELRELLADPELNCETPRGIAARTDSYKFGGHWDMLPEGTTHLNSYFESRPGAKYAFTKFVGLQSILKKYLSGRRVYEDEIEELIKFSENHLGKKCYFNAKGFRRMLKKHNGRLPVSIQAVKEGKRVPIGNVMMQIINTDDEFPWIVNYLETILTHVWYPSVVATKSASIVDAIGEAVLKSSDLPDEQIAFIIRLMLHCFGYRGATCEEAAGRGNLGHLSNSYGTDTLAGIWEAIDYYGADPFGKMVGLSVIATEHSIETAEFGEYGPDEGDRRYLKRMLKKFPEGVLSIVGDGNNIKKFVQMMCEPEFVGIIQTRGEQENGMLNRVVVRPDSPRWKGDTAEDQILWIADELWESYGGEINSKGYRVLNSAVGVIYGDGLSEEEIYTIYDVMSQYYDVTSFVVGQGGGLLQKVNRDTQRSAFKCSAQVRNGEWVDVYKNPMDTTKASKRGRLALIINDEGEYETIREEDLGDKENLLIEVFRDGELLVEWTLDDLRADWE
jgi:nicotinamide phosphoribosyltransferase